MGGTATVPIFAPDGSLGDIPAAQLAAAVKAGAKPGIHVTAPDGAPGVIPADRVPDAARAGAKIVPIEDQPVQHPGFWASMGADLGGMAKGLWNLNPYTQLTQTKEQDVQQSQAELAADKAAENSPQRQAHGALYRDVGVPAAETLGVNVPGMEQSAAQGDVAGVAGHAAAPVAAVVGTEALAEGMPAAADATKAAIAPAVRTTVRATNAALKEAPAAAGAAIGGYLGHATGVPEGTLSGVIVGRQVGNAVGKVLPPIRLPGEGFGFPDRVEGGPISAPAYQEPMPVYPGANLPEKPPTDPGAPLPAKPTPELLQANALTQGGAAPPPEPSAALGDLPVHAVQQALQELGPKAPIADLTARANNIAKLGDLLNTGLGGKPLQPNVPLRDQMNTVTPNTNLPEGHIPVESTALKSYKYDPAAREFESVTQDGQHYIYGDVPPEAAAKFEAADSKGRAWAELRKTPGVVRVAKVINGTRVPTVPISTPEFEIPEDEWEAGHDLGTEVEGTPH